MSEVGLKEWKYQVVAELVWKACPEIPELAKPWDDVAVNAVYEYEKDNERWQDGDPMFLQYEDNFVNKYYILNHKPQIREVLQREGKYIGWIPGRGNGDIYRATTPEQIKQIVGIRERQVEGQIESHNRAVADVNKTVKGVELPFFHTKKQLPSSS